MTDRPSEPDPSRDDEPDRAKGSRISTDEETIRRWAAEHDAVPVEHTASDDETAQFRVIPEENVGEVHEHVEWVAFFEVLDEWDYVVIYHGEAGAEPFEVVERDEAIARTDMDSEEFEGQLLEGNTVRSTITETTTIESVVVEEATIESELVDSEVLDQRVIDVELVDRTCTNCDLLEDANGDQRAWFDPDRYLDALDTTREEPDQAALGTRPADGVPYRPELDVEETWLVTRELHERFTVESHIEDIEITETDTIEDHEFDVQGLHRGLVDSGLLEVDRSPDEVMTEFDIESEIDRDDRIRTHFDRERVLQDEVVVRNQLQADITGGDRLEMETVRSEAIESGPVTDTPTEAEPDATEPTGTPTDEPSEPAPAVPLTEDEIGKTVVDAHGDTVGMVTDVDEADAVMYVDPEPSITDRIQAALDWGDVDEGDFPVTADQIERITDDEIELKRSEELE